MPRQTMGETVQKLDVLAKQRLSVQLPSQDELDGASREYGAFETKSVRVAMSS